MKLNLKIPQHVEFRSSSTKRTTKTSNHSLDIREKLSLLLKDLLKVSSSIRPVLEERRGKCLQTDRPIDVEKHPASTLWDLEPEAHTMEASLLLSLGDQCDNAHNHDMV